MKKTAPSDRSRTLNSVFVFNSELRIPHAELGTLRTPDVVVHLGLSLGVMRRLDG